MINKLNQKSHTLTEKIYQVFQASYAVEAKLLKAVDFPPLKREASEFLSCENDFYGYWNKDELVAVIEINNNSNYTHIQSLVVHPNSFRQGIAQKLISFVFDHYKSQLFMVETGVDNLPAIRLYEKFGFKEVKQWDTDHGVRKVRFERFERR